VIGVAAETNMETHLVIGGILLPHVKATCVITAKILPKELFIAFWRGVRYEVMFIRIAEV